MSRLPLDKPAKPASEGPAEADDGLLVGRRVAFAGRMGGLSQRETKQLVRDHGGICVERDDPSMNLLVIGADAAPAIQLNELEQIQSLSQANSTPLLNDEMREVLKSGRIEVLAETTLWERLGLLETHDQLCQLYTPAMLADLVGVSVATIRNWHRRKLIVPVKMVHRLPYFNFQEVTTARQLAKLIASGASPVEIEKKLDALAKLVPGVDRPLAQLSVIIEGKQILLREGEGLIEPSGQKRFDFDNLSAGDEENRDESDAELELEPVAPGLGPEQLLDLAMVAEEEGDLDGSADLYRAALAAGGPDAEISFQLAEVLYRNGHIEAAAERYFVAIELDEDYVEARANLGCVLSELGKQDLAIAAFQGALQHYDDYADVHFHLADAYEETGRRDAALDHWRRFLELSPNSPWADEARIRIQGLEDLPFVSP